MSHYCGMDLHSNNHLVVVIEEESDSPFNAAGLFVTGLVLEPCWKICRWFLPEDPAGAYIDKNTMVTTPTAAVGIVNRPWLMID